MVNPNRLYNMKSHDHHVMLQHILPCSICNLLHLGLRRAFIQFERAFQRICTKVLNSTDIPSLKTYVVKTLCMLEMWWLLGFFDLMTHLIIHLVEKLEICGLVASRWCYPIERYLYVLKKYALQQKVSLYAK